MKHQGDVADPSVLIAICTYGRKGNPRATLTSVVGQTKGLNCDVLIVDNNPHGDAAALAGEFAAIEYLHQPVPGIAAARNAAIDAAWHYDYLAFIDDDEVAHDGWIRNLLETAMRYEADVVTGPVETVFIENTPAWISDGGFFDRENAPTGSLRAFAASNNTLLATSALSHLKGLHFSQAFSLTGGSDSELFLRLSRAGARTVWCNEAIVIEAVGPERTRIGWLWQRGVREGNNVYRLGLAGNSVVAALSWAAPRVALGSLRCVGRLVQGRPPTATGLTVLARGIGALGSIVNWNVQEYGRSKGKGLFSRLADRWPCRPAIAPGGRDTG